MGFRIKLVCSPIPFLHPSAPPPQDDKGASHHQTARHYKGRQRSLSPPHWTTKEPLTAKLDDKGASHRQAGRQRSLSPPNWTTKEPLIAKVTLLYRTTIRRGTGTSPSPFLQIFISLGALPVHSGLSILLEVSSPTHGNREL